MTVLSDYLWVVFISMLPVVELRGAIPVAIGLGIKPIAAYFICVAANMAPVPLILLFVKPVFDYLKKLPRIAKIVHRLEKRAMGRSKNVQRNRFLGLAIFVAIPLPGTGAWTGALIATLLGMRLKDAILPIAIGVAVAGVVVALVSTGAFAGVSIIKDLLFMK